MYDADGVTAALANATPAAGTKMAWTKLKDRQVYDFAVVSVAVAFTVDSAGKWADGRVVLGGVAPVPYRAAVVETAVLIAATGRVGLCLGVTQQHQTAHGAISTCFRPEGGVRGLGKRSCALSIV